MQRYLKRFYNIDILHPVIMKLIPKGLDPMVESEEFFTVGQGSILVRALPGAMGTP
jgi:hypothetical protein